MSLFFIQSSTLTNIANAIRSLTGTTGSIAVSAFASAVANATPSGGGGLSGSDYDHLVLAIEGSMVRDIYTQPGLDYYFYDTYSHPPREIHMPNLSSLSYAAFSGCSSLSIFEAESCEYIGEGAFYSCEALSSISFPNCNGIDSYAFYGCSSLSVVSFPECMSIGSGAFGDCLSLRTAHFEKCSYIGESAFSNCYRLESVYLSANVYISPYAFDNFWNARDEMSQPFTIYLSGSSVGTVESNIFGDYYSLPKIYSPGGEGDGGDAGGCGTGGCGTEEGALEIQYLSIYAPASLYDSFMYEWSYFSLNIYSY